MPARRAPARAAGPARGRAGARVGDAQALQQGRPVVRRRDLGDRAGADDGRAVLARPAVGDRLRPRPDAQGLAAAPDPADRAAQPSLRGGARRRPDAERGAPALRGPFPAVRARDRRRDHRRCGAPRRADPRAGVTNGRTQAMDGSSLAEADEGSRKRGTLPGGARKAALLAVFAVVFLTIGVPRFLAGDPKTVNTNTPASFAKLCRAHGGTVAAGGGAQTQPFCEVRYGATVYRMDAITGA